MNLIHVHGASSRIIDGTSNRASDILSTFRAASRRAGDAIVEDMGNPVMNVTQTSAEEEESEHTPTAL